MNHNFKTSYNKAKPYEDAVLRYLESKYPKVREAKRKEQLEMGVDFIINEKTDEQFAIELKTDFHSKQSYSGNVVFEWQVITKRPNKLFIDKIKPGWTIKSQTDILYYWVVGDGIYVWDWNEETRNEWHKVCQDLPKKNISNFSYYGVISTPKLSSLTHCCSGHISEHIMNPYLL